MKCASRYFFLVLLVAGGIQLLLDLIGAPPSTVAAFEQAHFQGLFRLKPPPTSNQAALNSVLQKIKDHSAFMPAIDAIHNSHLDGEKLADPTTVSFIPVTW